MAQTNDTDLVLRIIVTAPPPGVQFRLQRGRQDLEPAAHTSRSALTFEFRVRVATRPSGEPNFLGPFTQGPPTDRFVYVNSGTLAGQADSCWSRRAKIPLTSITWALINTARASGAPVETGSPARVVTGVLRAQPFRYAGAGGVWQADLDQSPGLRPQIPGH